MCRAFLESPFIFLRIKIKSRNNVSKKSRILVIPQLTRVGDIICVTPTFRAIKEQYPDSFLAVLVSNKAAGILKNNPRIDKIIIFEEYTSHELVCVIRELDFHWSLNLSATSNGSIITFLGMVNNRIKTIRRNRPKSEVLTDWLNNYTFVYEDHTYLPKHHLKLLNPMRINNPKDTKEVFVSAAGEQKAAEFFARNNIKSNDFVVGISISAGNKIKEWGDDNFRKLTDNLYEKYGAKIIIIGGAVDDSRVEKFLRGSNKPMFKATGFSLEELPSLIKLLKLYIAVDTGLIYIAHALGIPLIDIIGPVDPKEQPPSDAKSIQVLPVPYVPPSSFVFKKNGPANISRQAIKFTSVESVLDATRQLHTL